MGVKKVFKLNLKRSPIITDHIREIAVKYSVKLILCICIFLPISGIADTWEFPERKEFYSPDEVVRFTVIPSRDFDNFEVGPIGLLERKNKMGGV